jgi:predicted O-methyltransferase YrrM
LLDDVNRPGEAEDFAEWAAAHPEAKVYRMPVRAKPGDPLYVHLKRVGILARGVELSLTAPEPVPEPSTPGFGLAPGPLPPLSDFSITPAIAGVLRKAFRMAPWQAADTCIALELGSGISTVVLAEGVGRCLGPACLLSLESSERWAQDVNRVLLARGHMGKARVVHCRLDAGWYTLSDQVKYVLAAGIKFLFIDGPPGYSGKNARLPAVFLLAPYFRPGAIIVVDDAAREDEAFAIREWRQRFGLELVEAWTHENRSVAVLRWTAT